MFCTNCGKNIREDAKFCQYCGSKTVIAAKGSTAGETVPDYPGSEYTIVYSPDGTGESRVEEISSRTGYQSNESAADGRGYQSGIKSAGGSDRAGFYASQTQPAHGSNPGSPQAAGHTLESSFNNVVAVSAGQLPDVQRTVFNLRYYDEMKYNEMSKVLNTSEGALKASYHIAVKKISDFFKQRD